MSSPRALKWVRRSTVAIFTATIVLTPFRHGDPMTWFDIIYKDFAYLTLIGLVAGWVEARPKWGWEIAYKIEALHHNDIDISLVHRTYRTRSQAEKDARSLNQRWFPEKDAFYARRRVA